jgi:predicted RNA-binding protein associated with RNAse of E/G family
MKFKLLRFGLMLILLITCTFCNTGDIVIKNNSRNKIITFGNKKIRITLDYNEKCAVTNLYINGESVISGPSGIFSEITTSTNT